MRSSLPAQGRIQPQQTLPEGQRSCPPPAIPPVLPTWLLTAAQQWVPVLLLQLRRSRPRRDLAGAQSSSSSPGEGTAPAVLLPFLGTGPHRTQVSSGARSQLVRNPLMLPIQARDLCIPRAGEDLPAREQKWRLRAESKGFSSFRVGLYG